MTSTAKVDQSNILDTLRAIKLVRVLSQDFASPSIYLLVTIDSVRSIVHLAKTNFDVADLATYLGATELDAEGQLSVNGSGGPSKAALIEQNDIYTWALAWFGDFRPADVKVNIISPCTDAHIRKYSSQKFYLFRETPEIYDTIVKPYIDSLPTTSIQWVYNILDGTKEQDSIVYAEGGKGEDGFVIMPDSKWDKENIKTLYLLTLVQTRTIKSMRDLEPKHIPLLKAIRRAAERVCIARYGLEPNTIRVFVHYQPSYYHFHVHIVNVENDGHQGTRVGKAHLLDDLISLLELSASVSPQESLIRKMAYTYVLGEQHALYALFGQAGLLDVQGQSVVEDANAASERA